MKLQLPEESQHPVRIVLSRMGTLEVELHWHVTHDRRQVLALLRQLGMFGQSDPCTWSKLTRMGQDIFQCSVLLDQFGRRFGADPGDAGDIVRSVSDQSFEIYQMLGLKTVPGDDRIPVKILELAATWRASKCHSDPVIHQLKGIHVTGGNDRVDATLPGLQRQSPQEIIGFKAILLVDGDVEGLNNLSNSGKLRTQPLRERRSVRLVRS